LTSPLVEATTTRPGPARLGSTEGSRTRGKLFYAHDTVADIDLGPGAPRAPAGEKKIRPRVGLGRRAAYRSRSPIARTPVPPSGCFGLARPGVEGWFSRDRPPPPPPPPRRPAPSPKGPSVWPAAGGEACSRRPMRTRRCRSEGLHGGVYVPPAGTGWARPRRGADRPAGGPVNPSRCLVERATPPYQPRMSPLRSRGGPWPDDHGPHRQVPRLARRCTSPPRATARALPLVPRADPWPLAWAITRKALSSTLRRFEVEGAVVRVPLPSKPRRRDGLRSFPVRMRDCFASRGPPPLSPVEGLLAAAFRVAPTWSPPPPPSLFPARRLRAHTSPGE